jgi:hypothetical protein
MRVAVVVTASPDQKETEMSASAYDLIVSGDCWRCGWKRTAALHPDGRITLSAGYSSAGRVDAPTRCDDCNEWSNPEQFEIPRCPECDGGWAIATRDRPPFKAGDALPQCDPYCSLQGAGRGDAWHLGDAL